MTDLSLDQTTSGIMLPGHAATASVSSSMLATGSCTRRSIVVNE